MSSRNVHVVPRDREWAVRREGTTRATSVHSTQKDAIESARKLAKTESTELVIHGRDGRIRERDSYVNDPFPSKETRRVLLPETDGKTARKRIEEAVHEVIRESATAS
jgi:hypothetical protein